MAVALSEALGRSKRQRVDYRGFDPHPMMRKLGRKILKHLGANFRSTKYIKSLESLDFAGVDRLLFTFSYVAHQGTIAPADKALWASVIKRAVNEVDRAVELIYTTAGLSGGALLDLKKMFRQAKIGQEAQPR